MSTAVESLLTLKRWREDEAKDAFALALKELAVEEDRLVGLEDALRVVEREFKRYSEHDTDIETIKRALEYQTGVLRQIESQRLLIQQKQEFVEKARLELVEATREKRIFERLLERQKEAEAKELLKREQIQSDESASIRFTYGAEE
jgi:flagellar FliJ protein